MQAYVNRAKAYNGTCNQLVTEDMASTYLPSYDEYQAAVSATADRPDSDPGKTPPIEFGRMEATASDPTVQQQFGMTVGIPNAGQVRALGMLNIRGQRSVTCKGDFDRHPSAGPLPPGAPSVCEEFRRQPDALERAEELDQQYGRNPDLAAMPMYCIPFSFKDPFDTKDMRSTGGADAAYDIDFPARDHTLVARLRETGAIIFAKANTTEYNGRGPGNPGGPNFPTKVFASVLGYQRSTWAGNPCNSYDTTRAASIGSSSGSGVSVSTNLVMCSLCEETGQSCRGPANHNSVALILPHKAHLSFLGGAIGAEIYNDRAGITLPRHHRRCAGAGCAQGSRQRLLRSVATSSRPCRGRACRLSPTQTPSRAEALARSRACASASSANSWSSTRRSMSRSSMRPRPK